MIKIGWATHGYARFFQKKLKCFSTNTTYNSFILLRTNERYDTMSYQNYQNQNQFQNEEAAASAAAAAAHYDNIMAQMDALDERAAEVHANADIRNLFRDRLAMINNADRYHTGDNVVQCRTIQMCDPEDWIVLFGSEQYIYPYAQRCMDYDQDETRTVPYVGELEVSMLLEENVTPGVHRAVFIVYVNPHQQFYDGHLIEMEYGEGSYRHQTINRMFAHAIVQEFTEYQILAFLADDTEMNSLLYGYFLDGFNPMRFGGRAGADDADAGVYDADAGVYDEEEDRRHACHNVVNMVLHDGVDPNAIPVLVPVPVVAIPPPHPVNDFAAIYRGYFGEDDEDDDAEDDDENWGEEDAVASVRG